MPDPHDRERERIAEVLAEVCSSSVREDTLGPVVLTGFALVVEWMADDGRHWLSRIDGPPGAVTAWKRDGMLHEALYGDWD